MVLSFNVYNDRVKEDDIMTENRFDFDGLFITDKGERKAFREVVDLLNSLNDENGKLRKELDNLKSSSAENQKVVQSNDDDLIKEVGGKLFFKI